VKLEIESDEKYPLAKVEDALLAWADCGFGSAERAERYQQIMDWCYHQNEMGIHALCVQGRAEAAQELRDHRIELWTFQKLGTLLGISRQAVQMMISKYENEDTRLKRRREQRLRNATARLPQHS